ncbi:tetratricopeptide (TPR) repeat protein [Bradyrhizobium sp. LB7.2]
MKDFDGAIADFAEAEKIEPAAQQITGNRCITYGMMGKFDQAFADCNGLIEKQPKNTYAINNRADVNMLKGDFDAALKDYNTAIQINPNNVRAHSGRGQIYERKKDLAQARADYRAAAYSLTKFDELDVARARAIARERLAALTPQAPAGSTGRRVALVIGNGAYKNVHALPNPPRDSKMIASVLRDVGFQTVISVSDLTRDKFFEALQTFAAEAEKADWAVVYYAGHGFEIGGVNYLVPVDAKLAADRDAETQAVALEQVIAAVGAARKVRLVMLDACRDNPFAPTMQRTLSLKLVDKGFSNIEPGAGFMVVYAAKHGETAMDGDGGARQPVRHRARPRDQGAARRDSKTVRHRPRRRLDCDQARAAAVFVRLAAGARGFLFRRGEVREQMKPRCRYRRVAKQSVPTVLTACLDEWWARRFAPWPTL